MYTYLVQMIIGCQERTKWRRRILKKPDQIPHRHRTKYVGPGTLKPGTSSESQIGSSKKVHLVYIWVWSRARRPEIFRSYHGYVEISTPGLCNYIFGYHSRSSSDFRTLICFLVVIVELQYACIRKNFEVPGV